MFVLMSPLLMCPLSDSTRLAPEPPLSAWALEPSQVVPLTRLFQVSEVPKPSAWIISCNATEYKSFLPAATAVVRS